MSSTRVECRLEELQSRIKTREARIKDLEKEIQGFKMEERELRTISLPERDGHFWEDNETTTLTNRLIMLVQDSSILFQRTDVAIAWKIVRLLIKSFDLPFRYYR